MPASLRNRFHGTREGFHRELSALERLALAMSGQIQGEKGTARILRMLASSRSSTEDLVRSREAQRDADER